MTVHGETAKITAIGSAIRARTQPIVAPTQKLKRLCKRRRGINTLARKKKAPAFSARALFKRNSMWLGSGLTASTAENEQHHYDDEDYSNYTDPATRTVLGVAVITAAKAAEKNQQ
jgi:hypothetical protein